MADRTEKKSLLDSESKRKVTHFTESLDLHDPENQSTRSLPGETVLSDNLQHKKRHILASGCILAMELCERMTYYSIVANLILYLTTRLDFSTPTANTIVMVFTGTTYFVPIIGGWIADSVAGKFNVIYGSGLIYIVGVALIAVTAIEFKDILGPRYCMSQGSMMGYFISGLVLVAVGSGGIKANVGPYGADQVAKYGANAVQTFFQWFYWFINIGSFVSYLGIAYIQQNISFCIGFFIPLLVIILSVVIFQLARNVYINTLPTGSMLSQAITAIIEGIKRRKLIKCPPYSFIDAAKVTHGGRHSVVTVEGVKSVARIMPIFLTLIVYWAIYSQMFSYIRILQKSTMFFTQTLRMDIHIGSFTPPVASLNLFNIIIILILIPIMDRFVYPSLEKCKRQPTLLQRIGLGFVLAGLSMVAAGLVEVYRKKDIMETGGMVQIIGGEAYNASTLTMFLQVPQFTLIGTSEIFTCIAALEFAYSQSPAEMKGLMMGVSLLMIALGSYLSSLIFIIVEAATYRDQWIPNEINNGHIDKLFFLLASLMCLNIFVFILLARWYRYVSDRPVTSRSSSYTSSGTTDDHDSPNDTPKPSVSDFPSDSNEVTHVTGTINQ